MEPVIIALVGGSVAAAIAGAVRARRLAKEADAAWTEAAERLGGTFTARRWRGLRNEPRTISAVVDGVPIALDHYDVNDGSSQQTYTRARATHSVAVALGLSISPRGALRNLAVALGAEDLRLGDPAFDAQAVIKRQDPELIRAWLDAPARAAFLAAPKVAITVKDGALTTHRDGLLLQAHELVALAQHLAAVAGGGARLLARWRDAARELDGECLTPGPDWPGDGTVVVRCHHQGRAATITCARVERVSRVTVALELRTRSLGRLVVGRREALEDELARRPGGAEHLERLDDPRLPPDVMALADASTALAGLPAGWFDTLAALDALRVERDRNGSVSVRLSSLGADAGAWRRALQLCDGLANDAGAPFR